KGQGFCVVKNGLGVLKLGKNGHILKVPIAFTASAKIKSQACYSGFFKTSGEFDKDKMGFNLCSGKPVKDTNYRNLSGGIIRDVQHPSEGKVSAFNLNGFLHGILLPSILTEPNIGCGFTKGFPFTLNYIQNSTV